jgi:integrase
MLKLIPPGRRKGNPFWIARGQVAGKTVEFSTRERDKGRAEIRAAEVLAELLSRRAVPEPDAVTFRYAAQAYTAWRSPGWEEVQRLNRVIADLGDRLVTEITNADLVACADRLCPTHKASSRNRLVITPCSAILHYAADQKWCGWLRIRRFKEARPETRALRPEPAAVLIAAASGVERVFLEFLFGQGMRVSDAIAITWERLDLSQGLIEAKIGKADDWRWKALSEGARAALASLPGEPREGRVFPWTNRWAVYRALEPIVKAAGVKFTPHMARHSLGTWLAAKRVSLKTRMDIMDHADPKSNLRYEMSQIPEQRIALGRISGKRKKAR